MKIAVNLVGISYGIRNRNWKLTASKIIEKVINCWNCDTDVYITTYNNDTIDDLLNFYKPKKYSILEYNEHSDQRLTYINSLQQIEDCDLIVSTRFDIQFYNKLNLYDINFEKFNFLFKEYGWWNNNKFISDNLFIFPKSFQNFVIDAIKEEYENPCRECCKDLHNLYNRLVSKIGENNIHCLSNDHGLSHDNAHYKLIRD